MTDPALLVRKITIGANHILNEGDVPEEVQEQPDLFVDHEALEKQKAVQAYGESVEKSGLQTADPGPDGSGRQIKIRFISENRVVAKKQQP